LFEIGVEEMPARFLTPALKQLKEMAAQKLSEYRLDFAEILTYGTPRRLVLFVRELAATQRPAVKEVKGPAAKVAFERRKKTDAGGSGICPEPGGSRRRTGG
jgi:glycyl-tRNA synthetase beta chain (EC 6.1.1.14)